MNAEIIAVGTELLLGQIVNTNAKYLSEKLSEAGINVYFQTVVGDNPARLKSTVSAAMERADILLLTGGLGPTEDDLTKETVAELFGAPLYLHEPSLKQIECFFDKIGRTMSESNKKQALIPECATVLPNPNGTAPGCILEKDGKYAILMPGPPREMKPMFDNHVFPFLKSICPERMHSTVLRIYGIGESELADKIHDLMQSSNPTVAPYAKEGEVTLRITAKAETEGEAMKIIAPVEAEIRRRTDNAVYAVGDDMTMAGAVAEILLQKNKTLAVAESCTGGMISSWLTDIPGVSSIFKEGVVTYSNDAKERLGVYPKTIAKYGAVSEQTAMEMADCVRRHARTDYGISVTGNAGPTGEPLGLVYVGFSSEKDNFAIERTFVGNRERIRRSAALFALNTLRNNI